MKWVVGFINPTAESGAAIGEQVEDIGADLGRVAVPFVSIRYSNSFAATACG